MSASSEGRREFDYVIVGGGSAGCVLASRLSEDPAVTVCLLEAGPVDKSVLIHCPAGLALLAQTGSVNWAFQTVPQPGLNGRRGYQPRGKVLGGSSSVNAMIYLRGQPLDYDDWAAAGNAGWRWSDVLPWFKKHENRAGGSSPLHGTGGELDVQPLRSSNPLARAFVAAAAEAGHARNADFNGPEQDGFGLFELNQRGGVRLSSSRAFLHPVLHRPNLALVTDALVEKIRVVAGRAVGVTIVRGGVRRELDAAGEVVLSAGTVNSPQLLMLSGIGPAADLVRHGIAVVHDLPGVGGNLQDHLRVSVRWQAQQPLVPSTVSAGLFTYSARAAAARATAPPDIQFYVGRGLDVPDPFVTLTVAMSQPASRGRLTLRSDDPLAPPLVRANYLSESSDLDAMVEAVRLAQGLANSSAYDAVRGAAVDPPEALRSDADIRAFIRRTADTIFHPVGTCAMGTSRDAVVDPQLRVQGITGLRVADASIFPVNLNSQIHAACVVIGDKCSDLVQ